jgi:hypothetical protein
MIKHPDLTALTPVISTAPPPLPKQRSPTAEAHEAFADRRAARRSTRTGLNAGAAEAPAPGVGASGVAGQCTLVPESPFGPGHLVAGQQAAALSNLLAAAHALQAAAAELEFGPVASDRGPEGSPLPLWPASMAGARAPAGGASARLARAVSGLFEAFTALRTCLLESSLSLSPRLVHDIFSVAHDRAPELASVGVHLAADGSLVVDEPALTRGAAAGPELLERLFAGPSGLAARLRRLALEVSVSIENIFAAMTPATPGLATLPSRLAELFGQALVAG